MSKHLWSYTGNREYKEGKPRGRSKTLFRSSHAASTGSDGESFTKYMAAETVSERTDSKSGRSDLKRSLVVKWLVFFAVFWIVFRFVTN